MACSKASVIMLALLLIAAPVCAEEENNGDDMGGDQFGGEGYGDDYGDPYGYGGEDPYGGGMGGADASDLSAPINGVLDLDKFTFNKVVGGNHPVFVQFYDAESSDIKDEIDALAEVMAPHPELILAKVDGDDEEDLVKQFSVESFPTLLFFAKGESKPKVYEGEVTADDVAEFLVDLVGEIGEVKELMPLVAKFLSNKGARANTVKETEEAVSALSDPAAGFGKWYIKIMNNIIKKGDEYTSLEFTRLIRMVYDEADSLKEEKLSEFRQRLTVLKVFDPALKEVEKKKKDELKSLDDVDVDDKDEL